MSQSGKKKNRKTTSTKKINGIYIGTGILVGLIAIFIVIKAIPEKAPQGSAGSGGDITITKSQVTEKATFIPYNSGTVKMELLAVKAPDGTVRTAFNTCQVCFDSGRGYYVQEGNQLVCQNCGNRFNISQIEKEKNGCNPVPILEENKTDDGETITISAEFLKQNADYFTDWKR